MDALRLGNQVWRSKAKGSTLMYVASTEKARAIAHPQLSIWTLQGYSSFQDYETTSPFAQRACELSPWQHGQQPARRRNQKELLPAAASVVTAAFASHARVWRGRVGDTGSSRDVSSRTRSRSRSGPAAGRRNGRPGS